MPRGEKGRKGEGEEKGRWREEKEERREKGESKEEEEEGCGFHLRRATKRRQRLNPGGVGPPKRASARWKRLEQANSAAAKRWR